MLKPRVGDVETQVAKTDVSIAFSGRYQPYESYMNGDGYLGGEAYHAACIDYILRRELNLGRENVHWLPSIDDIDEKWPKFLSNWVKYDRVIIDGFDWFSNKILPSAREEGADVWKAVLCRAQIIHFWEYSDTWDNWTDEVLDGMEKSEFVITLVRICFVSRFHTLIFYYF